MTRARKANGNTNKTTLGEKVWTGAVSGEAFVDALAKPIAANPEAPAAVSANSEHKPDGPVEGAPGVDPSEAVRDELYADASMAAEYLVAALDRTPAPPLFGGDRAAWAAFRATRAAVRGWIGEDADQVDPARLADQAVCMADYLRRAPTASDEAVLTQLSMRGKARGGDELLLFKVRIFRAVLAIADKQATAEAEPGPSDAERAAAAPKPDPRELSLKTVKEPLALSETAKGR